MLQPALALAAAGGLFAALTSAPAPFGPAADPEPPPSMVFVKGGRTKVGTDFKDLKKLLEDHPTLQGNYSSFISETPEHTVQVEDFFIMATEVTNEQFEAFVKSTGARPPRHWAEEQENQARDTFLREQGKAKRDAREAGEEPPPDKIFDPKEWWRKNWENVDWTLKDDLRPRPVTHIDYQDARNYARWAGMRLMTEEEYQRACRGNSTNPYPWGEKWEDGKYAATNEIERIKDVFPVGSFPDGASEDGALDLAGNVWEWTSSPFDQYPKFEYKPMKVGKGRETNTLDNPPNFNRDFRVLVGGSIQNSRFVARCTTRAGFDRTQITNSLGFRCASTPLPGLDMSRTLMGEIPRSIRPVSDDEKIGTFQYLPEETVAMDRWITEPGKATAPGYALIKDYEYVIVTPTEYVVANSAAEVRKFSLTEMLAPLGFLSTNQALAEPALPAGTYLLSFRGEGKTKKKRSARQAEEEDETAEEEAQEENDSPELLQELIGLDPKVDNVVFFDMTGTPVACMPIEVVDWGNPSKSSLAKVMKELVIPAENKKDDPTIIQQEWLEVRLFIPGHNSRKGFRLHLPLRFEDGVLDGDWRM